MKIVFIILFLSISSVLSSQTILTIEGKPYVNTQTVWDGVVISNSSPVALTFRNNSITSVNQTGYMLLAGDETIASTNNNLDGAIILGNKFTWNGTSESGFHGIMVGYNKNDIIKYNYLDKVPYGVVFKSGSSSGVNMTYTSGGFAYNIVKNSGIGIRIKGMDGVCIYNNTFYDEVTTTWGGGLIYITSNSSAGNMPSTGTKIKNNIFYTTHTLTANIYIETGSESGLECDYNIYYCTAGEPTFNYHGTKYGFTEWQALGYDIHSIVVNPNFIDFFDFVPTSRFNYGTDLGTAWQTGLSTAATWTLGASPETVNQNGTWQVGARIEGASSVTPYYISSVVENNTPTVIEMTYSSSLANKVPTTNAFNVQVNSVARTVNAVSISGTKVLLTLSSPVVNGEVVTVSYTKPATNPLQTASGGQAATLSAQTVVNNVSPAIPVYVSSAVQNSTPNTLEITYNLNLAIVVPSSAAFSVKVNSVARTVNTVSISGSKVLLTLASPVINSDVVTVSYTRPAANPIQTSSGAQAATISAQTAINNVLPGTPPVYVSSAIENATPGTLDITYNLSLAAIVPAASSFTVTVNSVARPVNTVTISGTKVLLTLVSPVVYGDIITVGYTKSATNPLQTPSGGQAGTISAQSVTNKIISPIVLGYVNSAVGNTLPTLLEINFNLNLANILPAVSAFSVRVNSVTRNVNSVSISGASVVLTLATEVVYGDVVTVAYTKPATNPLQSASGLQASTMSAQAVTNKVSPVGLVYVSSAIENITPNILEITYNEPLDLTAPGASAFVVMVNRVKREVTSVFISGNKVMLTLSSPVVYGDNVTVSYIKPASNQLKKATGEIAVSFSFPQPVTNKLANSIKKGNISVYPNPAKEVINVSIKETSLETQILRIFDLSGKLCLESKLNSGSNNQILIDIKSGIYIVQINSGSAINFVQKLIVTNY